MKTNNHPANGPVSLDRLHQISEILRKAAAQSDGGNLGYAMADAVKVINGAIAAFGVEPVAWMIIDIDTGEKIIRPDRSYFEGPCQPLYAAPQLPQPAVPECFQRLLHHAYGMTMGHDWNKGTMAGHHRGKLCKAVEDCRAAMIQAGSSPVTQDGSERCPCCGKKLRRACSVEGCSGKHIAHGLCQKHYDMKRWEDPEQVKKFREANKRFRDKKKSVAAAPQQEVKSE